MIEYQILLASEEAQDEQPWFLRSEVSFKGNSFSESSMYEFSTKIIQ